MQLAFPPAETRRRASAKRKGGLLCPKLSSPQQEIELPLMPQLWFVPASINDREGAGAASWPKALLPQHCAT